MNCVLSCVLLAVAFSAVESGYHRIPPKVQLYSRGPAELGKENILICLVSEFHPPDISIDLLRNGEELPNAQQTDLAFRSNWQFHLTKSVPFTPNNGDNFICRINHGGMITNIAFEPNM